MVKDTLTGTLEYADQLVAMGTMGYKHESMAGNGDLSRATLSKTQINLKLFPGVDGRAEVCQLVAINLTDIVVKGSWIARAGFTSCRMSTPRWPTSRSGASSAPIISSADLTLPYGRVVHDYNKEPEIWRKPPNEVPERGSATHYCNMNVI